MTAYIIRRILYTVPQVLGICLLTFLLFEVVYTPRARAIAESQKGANPQAIAEKIFARGWGKPLFFNAVSSRLRQQDVFDWRTLAALLTAARDAGQGQQPGPAAVWQRLPAEARDAIIRMAPEEKKKDQPQPSDADKRTAIAALNAIIESKDFHRLDAFKDLSEQLENEDRETAETEPDRLNGRQVRRLNRLALHAALGKEIARRYYSHATGFRRLTDTRFVDHMKKLLLFRFGRSEKTQDLIGRKILHGMVPSLTLTVPLFLMGLVTGISLSLAVAYFRGTYLDLWAVVVCVAFMSVSILVYIIAGQYLLAIHLRLFPVYGFAPGVNSLRFLILPVFIGIVKGVGGDVRFYRTIFVEETNRDYVRTARAKGLSEQAILFKHVLKNAMIPILTRTVLAIPFLFMGSLLLENFFGIPGLGNMTIEAINNGDFQVVVAMVYLGALLFAAGNLLTDISYTFVDPRVRLQ